MNNEYTASEVIEIGEAQEVILGQKFTSGPDEGQNLADPGNDLDD